MEPVFMDRSGRRRRVITALGAALGVLLFAGVGLLVTGLLGSSRVPLPGLPDSGRGALQQRDAGGGRAPVPAPAPATSVPPATHGPKTSAATPSPAPVATSTKPGNRPASHPGNPKSSRTK
ncbi:hypothetical protein AB0M46_46840 [Dactylosporangium sp. NPDC051485]|uniref:hypothetical protein n=1 Tax=Dactylosporangium sp. NPDC051485 TaxID=3154846 RepID=UPI003413AE06